MDETKNKGSAGEAVFAVLLFFVILIVLLYKFGTGKDSVINPDTNEANKENFLNQLDATGTESDLYNKYIKQVYETQSEASITTSDKRQQIDQIVTNYQKELEEKTSLPPQTIVLKNVSNKFSERNYANNFEIMFSQFKQKGGTSESALLVAQTANGNEILTLSEYDKENLLRIADQYQDFANKVSNLSTPESLEKKAHEIAVSSLNVAYILRQMANENDKQVYTLWISKYAQNMFVIITDRYALQTSI
jgi:predicted metal-dependent hydrolase